MRKRSILLIVLVFFLGFSYTLDVIIENQPISIEPLQIQIGDVVELNYTMWIGFDIKENNTTGKVYVDHVPVNATIPIDVVIRHPDIKLIPNEGFLKIILGMEENDTRTGDVSVADGYHEGEYAYQELFYQIQINSIYERPIPPKPVSWDILIRASIALIIILVIYEIFDRRAVISAPIQTKCRICETNVAILKCKHCPLVYCRACLKHQCSCGGNRFQHV